MSYLIHTIINCYKIYLTLTGCDNDYDNISGQVLVIIAGLYLIIDWILVGLFVYKFAQFKSVYNRMQSVSNEIKIDKNLQQITNRMYCILQKISLLVLIIQMPYLMLITIQWIRPYINEFAYWFTYITILYLVLVESSFCSLLMLEHNNKLFEYIAIKYLRWLKCIFPHLFVLIDENIMEASHDYLEQQQNEKQVSDEIGRKQTRVSFVSVKIEPIQTPTMDEEKSEESPGY